MSMAPEDHDSLDALLCAMSSGELDEARRAELEQRLQTDAAARRRYLDYVGVDAMLRWRLAGTKIEALVAPKPRIIRWPLCIGLAAAAALAIGLPLFLLHRPHHPEAAVAQAQTPPPAGQDEGAEVAEGGAPPMLLGAGADGNSLPPEGGALPQEDLQTGVEVVKFSPDGKLLACFYRSQGRVIVCQAEDQTRIAAIDVKQAEVSMQWPFLAFSRDSKLLVFTGCTHIQIFRLPSGELLKELANAEQDEFYADSAAFSPDGKQLFTGHRGGRVLLWDIETGRRVGEFALDEKIAGKRGVDTQVFSDDQQILAITSLCAMPDAERETVVWNPVDHMVLHRLQGSHPFVSNDLKMLGTIRKVDSFRREDSAPPAVNLWDLQTGKLLHALLPDDLNGVADVATTRFAISGDNQSILFFREPSDMMAVRLADHKEVFRKHFDRTSDSPVYVHDIQCSPANNGQVAVGMRFNIMELFYAK